MSVKQESTTAMQTLPAKTLKDPLCAPASQGIFGMELTAHQVSTSVFFIIFFYIKACVLNNSARALLAFQVTYFPTRNRIKI